MAQYGYHPTIYAGFSDAQLFAMYRSEQWSSMGEDARRELLQETVNRAALANGEQGACRVEFADLGSTTAGVQSGDVIRLDRNRFVNDMTVSEYNGHVIQRPLEASNLQALETVLHEDIHAWQNQCLDGTITNIDPSLLEEYRANNFDTAVVQTADGNVNIGQQYLNSQKVYGGYYLYYCQSTERDAHRFSEGKTMEIAGYLERTYGPDPSIDAYREEVGVNGYEATMARAQEVFQDPAVEQDVNTTLMNQYYGTDVPVSSPWVEDSVKHSMVESFQEGIAQSQQTALGSEPVDPAGPELDGGIE